MNMKPGPLKTSLDRLMKLQIRGLSRAADETLYQLDKIRRDADWEANHVHFWDSDSRCTVCGEEGRA